MNPGKQRINKIIILMLVLCTSRAFAYDYSWPVDYQIKNDSINEIDMIIQNHIYNTPELHVYEINWNTYALGIKEDGLKLLVYFDECIPFGNILEGKIYLKDVNAVVFFYLPQIQGKNYLRLISYCTDFYPIDEKHYRKKWGSYTSFNDVEPTKAEIPIKESFERNFLAKLPLEFEYQKPAALDRFLSKLITTLYRPRKNFVDY